MNPSEDQEPAASTREETSIVGDLARVPEQDEEEEDIDEIM